MVPIIFNENRHFWSIHQRNDTIADESICGKFVRIFCASAYDEYFGQKVFIVGSKMVETRLARGHPRSHTHVALHYSSSH